MNSLRYQKNILVILGLSLNILFPVTLHASFIESTMGAAVVNDATATYYNPAALTLLKNSQFITLGSATYFRTRFTGQSIQSATGFTQTGSSSAQTHYYLPSFYLAIPAAKKITVGVAVISNFLNTNIEENSILRYDQSSNNIENVDLITAIGLQFNEFFSLGAGVNFSYANFLLRPTSGFPSLNIPDNQSRNEANGTGSGADFGILVKPSPATTIGFNYRSAITYQLSGSSKLEGAAELISNNYHFNFWTPARSVLSINQFITPALGFIGTIQRIQWSIFKNVDIHGIATQAGSQQIIVNAVTPYHYRNTWLLTLGSHYRVNPKLIIRIAGSYNQSPGNSSYQIVNGNSIIAGASIGYELTKKIMLDGSYAHAFIQNRSIHIVNGRNIINGLNRSYLDAVSLKLIFNIS